METSQAKAIFYRNLVGLSLSIVACSRVLYTLARPVGHSLDTPVRRFANKMMIILFSIELSVSCVWLTGVLLAAVADRILPLPSPLSIAMVDKWCFWPALFNHWLHDMIFFWHATVSINIYAWVVRRASVRVLHRRLQLLLAFVMLMSWMLTIVPLQERNLGLYKHMGCFLRHSYKADGSPRTSMILDRMIFLPASGLLIVILNTATVIHLRKEVSVGNTSTKRLQVRLLMVTAVFVCVWALQSVPFFLQGKAKRTFVYEFYFKWLYAVGLFDALTFSVDWSHFRLFNCHKAATQRERAKSLWVTMVPSTMRSMSLFTRSALSLPFEDDHRTHTHTDVRTHSQPLSPPLLGATEAAPRGKRTDTDDDATHTRVSVRDAHAASYVTHATSYTSSMMSSSSSSATRHLQQTHAHAHAHAHTHAHAYTQPHTHTWHTSHLTARPMHATTFDTHRGAPPAPDDQALKAWIPKELHVYAIALQRCKSVSKWRHAIHEYLGGPVRYTPCATAELGGGIHNGRLCLLLFARTVDVESGAFKIIGNNQHSVSLSGPPNRAARGMVGLAFRYYDATVAVIGAHLPPIKADTLLDRDRSKQLSSMLQSLRLGMDHDGFDCHLQYHHVVLLGQFNYGCRTTSPHNMLERVQDAQEQEESSEEKHHEDDVIDALRRKGSLRADAWAWVEGLDVLCQRLRQGSILHGFKESRIAFAPSYKWQLAAHTSDTHECVVDEFRPHTGPKAVTPAYCDRVLVHSLPDLAHRLNLSTYTLCPLPPCLSDHRPVSQALSLLVNTRTFDEPELQPIQRGMGSSFTASAMAAAAVYRQKSHRHRDTEENPYMTLRPCASLSTLPPPPTSTPSTSQQHLIHKSRSTPSTPYNNNNNNTANTPPPPTASPPPTYRRPMAAMASPPLSFSPPPPSTSTNDAVKTTLRLRNFSFHFRGFDTCICHLDSGRKARGEGAPRAARSSSHIDDSGDGSGGGGASEHTRLMRSASTPATTSARDRGDSVTTTGPLLPPSHYAHADGIELPPVANIQRSYTGSGDDGVSGGHGEVGGGRVGVEGAGCGSMGEGEGCYGVGAAAAAGGGGGDDGRGGDRTGHSSARRAVSDSGENSRPTAAAGRPATNPNVRPAGLSTNSMSRATRSGNMDGSRDRLARVSESGESVGDGSRTEGDSVCAAVDDVSVAVVCDGAPTNMFDEDVEEEASVGVWGEGAVEREPSCLSEADGDVGGGFGGSGGGGGGDCGVAFDGHGGMETDDEANDGHRGEPAGTTHTSTHPHSHAPDPRSDVLPSPGDLADRHSSGYSNTSSSHPSSGSKPGTSSTGPAMSHCSSHGSWMSRDEIEGNSAEVDTMVEEMLLLYPLPPEDPLLSSRRSMAMDHCLHIARERPTSSSAWDGTESPPASSSFAPHVRRPPTFFQRREKAQSSLYVRPRREHPLQNFFRVPWTPQLEARSSPMAYPGSTGIHIDVLTCKSQPLATASSTLHIHHQHQHVLLRFVARGGRELGQGVLCVSCASLHQHHRTHHAHTNQDGGCVDTHTFDDDDCALGGDGGGGRVGFAAAAGGGGDGGGGGGFMSTSSVGGGDVHAAPWVRHTIDLSVGGDYRGSVTFDLHVSQKQKVRGWKSRLGLEVAQ